MAITRPLIKSIINQSINEIIRSLSGGVLNGYDTAVGVGDSITQGEFNLTKQFESPFRGTAFSSAAVPGTTLQYMIDNVHIFTDLAVGKTLFIVRAGINDCNTFLSAGGVGDGAGGVVLSWGDMSQAERELTESRYRELVSLLKPFGDVALASLTYCDAKGQLVPLPDKGLTLHSGSWNAGVVTPLCQELTPDWYNSTTSQPLLDYYSLGYADPTILDDDNLHYYDDYTYTTTEAGYVNGPGSYTLRKYMLDTLVEKSLLPSLLGDTPYIDRILVNLGRQAVVDGRPNLQRYANNLLVDGLPAPIHNNLSSLNPSEQISPVSLVADYTINPGGRINLATTNQPWDEGVLDYNAISGGILVQGTRLLTLTLTNIGKGRIYFAGFFLTDVEDDAQYSLGLGLLDDNGTGNIIVPNTFNNALGSAEGKERFFDYDCRVSGELKITLSPAGTAIYGTLSSIQIDVEEY